MIRLLIRCRINININIQNDDGLTPLMYACGTKDVDICKLLLDNGAQTNIKNRKGETALIFSKDEEIKKLLTSHDKKD